MPISRSDRARRAVGDAVRRLPPPLDRAALDLLRAAHRLVTRAQASRPPALPESGRNDLSAGLQDAFTSKDAERISTVLREVHHVRALAERLASPPVAAKQGPVSGATGITSTQYMVELLPHIQALLAEQPRGRHFTVLDVGPGSGHGTALLADLYATKRLGYSMEVTALDIRPTYRNYIAAITPRVPFVLDDIFRHGTVYDICIASHVIEHVRNPVEFCRRLQELSRLAAFVGCPYEEPADRLVRGHVSVIDDAIVKQLQADEVTITPSAAWGPFTTPRYQALVARLPGLAGRRTTSRPTASVASR